MFDGPEKENDEEDNGFKSNSRPLTREHQDEKFKDLIIVDAYASL